jgi:tRNA pseudouridine38-40 synthase
MVRYLLHISFQGTNYSGWQSQENSNTVQSEIDGRLSQLCASSIQSIGCGRTDTGVHASNFYLHFDTEKEFKEEELTYKLNRMLPDDISVHSTNAVNSTFHARFDAFSRTYHFIISKQRNPFLRNLTWNYHLPLKVEAMHRTVQFLKEYEDFSSFSKSNTQVKTNFCKVMEVAWKETPSFYIFTITANRFLRNMVRAIVGTSIQIGLEKLDSDGFRAIIEAKDRKRAFESVPGCGLYLTKVEYPITLLQNLNLIENPLPYFL